MSDFIQVAVDGPAVSGKSSAAKQLAHQLGWLYLDSGAIYRSITLCTLRGFQIKGDHLFSRLDEKKIRLVANTNKAGCSVFLDEEDISEKIRTEEVTSNILPISGNPEVREWVTEYLREAAKSNHVVMDGRDIGSVVFPDAKYKFYVTASLEARTKRRLTDLKGKDRNTHSAEEIYAQLEKRDEGDKSRKIGPLVQVSDAIFIDNSELNLTETVDNMLKHINFNGDDIHGK